MKKKNNELKNEGIGIFTIIIIMLVAVLGIYFLYTHKHHSMPAKKTVHIPLETPAPQ